MEPPEQIVPSVIPPLPVEMPPPSEPTAVVAPEKPKLLLAWKIRLLAGTVALPTIKGHEEVALFDHPDQALPFLKLCDECFDLRIAQPLIRALRTRFLIRRDQSAAAQDAEIALKVTYDIRLGGTTEPEYQCKGALETVLQQEPRSLRGQIGLLEGSLLQAVFNPVRVNFRQVAAYLVEHSVAHKSAETAMTAIRQEIQSILQPDMVPADELPPTIEDITILIRPDHRENVPSSDRACESLGLN